MINNNFANNNNNGGNIRKATTRQINYYNTLCQQKGEVVNPQISNMTAQEVSNEISRLQAINNQQPSNFVPQQIDGFQPSQAPIQQQQVTRNISDKQAETIYKLSSELGLEPNITIKQQIDNRLMTSEQASQLINQFINMKQTSVSSQPSDEQIELLKDMYKCPEVIVEDFYALFPINQQIIVNKQKVQNRVAFLYRNTFEENGEAIKNHETQKRKMADTLVQINKEIENFIFQYDWKLLDAKEVGNFISDNMKNFRSWKASLATDQQIEYIRNLQKQIATFYKWSINFENQATDIDGNHIDPSNTVGFEEFEMVTGIIMDPSQLSQLTREVATELIAKMRSEIDRTVEINDSSVQQYQQYTEDEPNVYKEAERMYDSFEKEQIKLVQLIEALYMNINQEVPYDEIDAKNYKEFIKYAIEMNEVLSHMTEDMAKRSIFGICDRYVDAKELYSDLGIAI